MMAYPTRGEAAIPNPALQPFTRFIGEWRVTGRHPLVPGKTFHGRATFEWIEGGAFCRLQTEIDEPEIPTGIAIFGSDDDGPRFYMIYFDERGVSRKYDVIFRDGALHWERDSAGLSQRFTITVGADGRRMEGKGIMSRDGKTWEGDLELTYSRQA
jgi:hypothetical protein